MPERQPKEAAKELRLYAARLGQSEPVADSLPFDLGYVYAYLKAALLDIEPEGLTDPQAAYFFEWFKGLDRTTTP